MRILIVEDEEKLALRIQNILESERYHAEVSFDGRDGLEKVLTEEYDLVILDIMLPGIDGMKLLREIRKEGIVTPVIMLTARDQIDDKVSGLDAGADDYLTKPFAVAELLARIRSLLRRSSEEKSSVLTVGDVEIDTSLREVRKGGVPVNLTAKEYSILEFLFYNKNRVVSRLSIAEHVWGDNLDLFTMTNFVDVHIKNLRKKLGDHREKKIIQTVRSVGYMVRGDS